MQNLSSMIEGLWDMEFELEDKMYPDNEEGQEDEFEDEEEDNEEILALLEDYGRDISIFESHLFTIAELKTLDVEHANALEELVKEFITDDSWLRIEFDVIREYDYIGLLLGVYRKSNEWYIPCGRIEESYDVKENNSKKFTRAIVKKMMLRNKELQMRLGFRL
jgi:hypothetical protein